MTSDEAMCAMDLLQAYEESDEDRLKKCIAKQVCGIFNILIDYHCSFMWSILLICWRRSCTLIITINMSSGTFLFL